MKDILILGDFVILFGSFLITTFTVHLKFFEYLSFKLAITSSNIFAVMETLNYFSISKCGDRGAFITGFPNFQIAIEG